MKKFDTVSALASIGLLMAPTATPVAASQDQPPQQASGQTQEQIAPVTDEEIASYVRASEAVNEITEALQSQLEQAQSEAQVDQLQITAQEDMAQVVADNGLTLQRYNQISAAARNDPELRERISRFADENGG